MFILLAFASSLAADNDRRLMPLERVPVGLSIELILAATRSKVVSWRCDWARGYLPRGNLSTEFERPILHLGDFLH